MKRGACMLQKNRISFFMITSIFVLLLGMYLFGNGYHSADLGHNMKYLEAEYDMTMYDVTLQGEKIDSNYAYRMGHWQIRISMALFIFGGMIFGVSFAELLNLIKEK